MSSESWSYSSPRAHESSEHEEEEGPSEQYALDHKKGEELQAHAEESDHSQTDSATAARTLCFGGTLSLSARSLRVQYLVENLEPVHVRVGPLPRSLEEVCEVCPIDRHHFLTTQGAGRWV